MQRINVSVLGPLFLGVFVGTAVLAGICVFAGFFPWGETKSLLLFAAGLLYLVGTFGVTVAFNVPCNDRLARMGAESADAAAYWPRYVREWLFWNHCARSRHRRRCLCGGRSDVRTAPASQRARAAPQMAATARLPRCAAAFTQTPFAPPSTKTPNTRSPSGRPCVPTWNRWPNCSISTASSNASPPTGRRRGAS